ncbi:MAG TPA: hypothetical protein VK689_17420, partial [Armatimonadota bacterium]|nr:hypothetical protein [Armatimonadota bacterium]
LQKVMERALAKDPNRRYQCGVELAAEVAKACRSLRPPVKSRSRPTRTVDATDPAGKQAAARRAGTPKVPAQKAPARPRTSLKEVSKRVAVVAVSLSRKGWGTSEAILKATGGGTARLKAGISAAGQRGAAALRARSAKEKRVGAQVAETPATSAAVAAPPVAPSVAANTEAPEATPRSTGGEKSETPPAPKPAFRVALPRVVAAAGLAMVVAGIALGARFLPRRPTAPTAAPLVSSAGQGASTAPSAVEKRRADQAKLEQRFHGYLDRFEKYHRERKRFNVDERHRRLAGFKRQLDALMAEYEVGAPVGKEHDAFRSEVCRELGTLEWYLADRYSARRQWRRALALDPGNALARAWLRETKGAVLEE